MTGLLNEDAFRLDVRTYLSAAGPEETYALLVTDLDDFKRFNDRYGHAFGDQVLLAFAAILSRSFGPGAPVRTVWGRRVCGLSAWDRSPDR